MNGKLGLVSARTAGQADADQRPPVSVCRTAPCGAGETAILEGQGVRFDLYRHRAFFDSSELCLTPTEFRVLECLLRAAGRLCTTDALAACALKTRDAGANVVACHIKELRRKLSRPGLIGTVRNVGYRLGNQGAEQPERKVDRD